MTSPADGSVTERATYGELLDRAERLAAGLRGAGFRPQQSIILATPVSLDFYALSIAIVGSGLRLVLIDGRLDRRRMLSALRSARPRGIVSVPEVLRRWPLVPPLWRTRRYATTALEELLGVARRPLAPAALQEPAIISFTSGSSGRAKGVVRTGAILRAQHLALQKNIPFLPGDVDMTCFPAVVLHNLASGVTTVLPPVDLRAPATVDPVTALEVIEDNGVTTLSGAPAFIGRIADHVAQSAAPGPSLRQIVLGGAPVTQALCRKLVDTFPDTTAVIVYGSTEAEPITSTTALAVLAENREADGLLVGAPVDGVDVAIVTLPEHVDEPVTDAWIRARRTEVGEVIVSGANVSRMYVGDPEAGARNKLQLLSGGVWHRTGDLARWDAQGRLRLLGRIGDAITHGTGVLHPLPVEAALAATPGVRRVALVAVAHRAVLAAEIEPGATASLHARLTELGLGDVELRAIETIPVDVRHQSKIDRPALVRLLDKP